MRSLLTKTKTFIEHHEQQLSAGALCVGFIIDSLTLRRVDLLIENIVLMSYLLITAVCIAVLNLRHTKALGHRFLSWMVTVAPFVMQVFFGALFSAFVVFYSRSASLSASWPFMLFLAAMLIGNEAFRPYYERTAFHIAIWFVGLLSYSIFAVPTLVGSIGALVFATSVAVALVVTAGFVWILSHSERIRVEDSLRYIKRSIVSITTLVVIAYAFNLIPPIPLALKDAAVAHSVERVGDEYKLILEPRSVIDQLLLRDVFHKTPGESVSVWTSVFAPTDLSTTIVHEWQRRVDGAWVTEGRIPFAIRGGADGGYRGYSTKTVVAPGKWRVSVETAGGQVIGRVRFNVVDVERGEELKLLTR